MGLLPSAKGKSLERAAGGRQQRLGGRYAGQQRGLRGPPPPPSPTAHLPGHAQLPALCPPPCSRYVRLPSHEVPHSSSECPCRPPSCLPRLSPTCHPFPLPQLPCRGHSNRLLQNFLWLPALLAWERGGGSPPFFLSPPSFPFSQYHVSGFLCGYPNLLKCCQSSRHGSESPVSVCSALVQRDAASSLTGLSVRFHVEVVYSREPLRPLSPLPSPCPVSCGIPSVAPDGDPSPPLAPSSNWDVLPKQQI